MHDRFGVLPPGACVYCGHPHGRDDAHHLDGGRYQAQFLAAFGRLATWADAIAHCDARTQVLYLIALRRRRIWSEPRHGLPVVQPPRYAPGAPGAAAIAAETVLA